MAANVLLDLDGVEGESLVKGFEGKIEIISISWGVSMPTSLGAGTGGGVCQANFSDLSLAKYTDKSTPALFSGCCSGKHFDKMTLTLLKSGGDDPVPYLKYEMTDVMITSFNLSDSAGSGSLAVESLSLAYNTIEMTYTGQKDDGTPDAQTPIGWDLTTNAKLG